MMKRKILAVVLPIVGCATVVGSGFSAWYFGQDVFTGDNGNTNVGVEITDEVTASKANLNIDQTATTVTGDRLILDQGGARNYSTDSGIMFGAATATETTATSGEKWEFTVSYVGETQSGETSSVLTIDEIYKAGMRLRFEVSVELKGSLGTYVEFQNGLKLTVNPDIQACDKELTLDDDPGNTNRVVGNYVVTNEQVNGSDATSLDWTFTLGLDTTKKDNGDYSNALLVYKPHTSDENGLTGGKPVASGEPEDMKKALTNSDPEKLTHFVSFNVVACIENDPER